MKRLKKGIQTSAKGLNDARVKGTGPFADGIKQMGLELSDFDDLSGDKLLKVLAEEISKVEDPLEQAALAQKLFGGAGKELLPTLKGGAAGLAALTAEAERKSNIMSSESERSAEMVNDAINSSKQAV